MDKRTTVLVVVVFALVVTAAGLVIFRQNTAVSGSDARVQIPSAPAGMSATPPPEAGPAPGQLIPGGSGPAAPASPGMAALPGRKGK
jgi:hypothetical protein